MRSLNINSTDNQHNQSLQDEKKEKVSPFTVPKKPLPPEQTQNIPKDTNVKAKFTPLRPIQNPNNSLEERKTENQGVQGVKTLKIPKNSSFTKREPDIVEPIHSYDKKDDNEKENEFKNEGEKNVSNVSNKQQEERKNESEKPLSVTEFYCLHHNLIKEVIDNVLITKYGGNKISEGTENEDVRFQIQNEASEDVVNYIDSKNIPGIDFTQMPNYVQLVFAEAMGFGILEFLLKDKEVDEIMVQKHDAIFAEKHGIPVLTEYKFPNFDVALGIVKRIIRPLNKTLDVSNPNVDGQLPNGSRISASIPPLRAEGEISITIRKFSEKVEPLGFYAEKFHSSTPEMVKFIESCVTARKTMIVSGGTGSGKTTLLNSLSFAFNKNERILVIEDTREIHCQIPHVEYYLKVDANAEGYKGISISDIIQMSLRKRPDRILVGECRGGEFNEYLNAANTGHDGSMTSVHANSPQQLFQRTENMLLKNDETKNMTHEAIMRTLAASVDIIVQTKRLADGSRRITNVTEVLGYGKDGFDKLKKMKLIKDTEECDPYKIYMRDVFYFKEIDTEEILNEKGEKRLHVKGQFIATGYIPFCNRELKRKGLGFDNDFFTKRVLLEV